MKCSNECTCAKHKRANLSGRRFGRLLAVRDVGANKFRKRLWECQCSCGRTTTVPSLNLTSGNTRSCGCFKLDNIVEIGHKNLGVYGRNGRKLNSGDGARLRYDAFNALTPESAYWVGFLMADGYINRCKKGAPDVALCLSIKDKEHVYKFKGFLHSDRAVSFSKGRYPTAIFSVSSESLVTRLEQLGVTTHKTFTARVDEKLADNPHFWRGLIDGDGCLHKHKKTQVLPIRDRVRGYLSSIFAVC